MFQIDEEDNRYFHLNNLTNQEKINTYFKILNVQMITINLNSFRRIAFRNIVFKTIILLLDF